MGLFVKAWKKLGVRPNPDSDHPERTNENYCYYDSRHEDYGYTSAYVKKLVRELNTAAGWRAFYGEDPQDKATGEWVRLENESVAEEDAGRAAGASA